MKQKHLIATIDQFHWIKTFLLNVNIIILYKFWGEFGSFILYLHDFIHRFGTKLSFFRTFWCRKFWNWTKSQKTTTVLQIRSWIVKVVVKTIPQTTFWVNNNPDNKRKSKGPQPTLSLPLEPIIYANPKSYCCLSGAARSLQQRDRGCTKAPL